MAARDVTTRSRRRRRIGSYVSFMRGANAFLILISVSTLSASFTFAQPAAPGDDLSRTVTYLLDFVANSNSTFVRNGQSYSSMEAAKHMQAKYDYFKNEIRTPEDIIRLAASKSLFSGRPYLVRTQDGKEMKAADWLGKALNDYRISQRVSDRE